MILWPTIDTQLSYRVVKLMLRWLCSVLTAGKHSSSEATLASWIWRQDPSPVPAGGTRTAVRDLSSHRQQLMDNNLWESGTPVNNDLDE